MASSPSTPSSPTNTGQQHQQQQQQPADREAAAAAGAGGSIPQTLWDLRVPVVVRHRAAPAGAAPLVASVPRLAYLAQLLPRASAFFGAPCSSFHHEEVQLRNLAAGLLVDLYRPALPWALEVGEGDEWDIRDTFLNGVKEVSLLASWSALEGRGRGEGVQTLWCPCPPLDPFLSAWVLVQRKPQGVRVWESRRCGRTETSTGLMATNLDCRPISYETETRSRS